MTAFQNSTSKSGFSFKLWRGERTCLLGFDVDQPEPDFVGFAIECCAPGESQFTPLLNRIAFSYPTSASAAVTGARQFPSTTAPFQKFRWLHFPFNPQAGSYNYRATKMHMPSDNTLKKGISLELDISLDPVTYNNFLDVGFTRNFASSQAFIDKFPPGTDLDVVGKTIIPSNAADGLKFTKLAAPPGLYPWMGFEAYDLLFGLLNEAVSDPSISLDVFSYDFNEPDILAKLKTLGPRLRIILDNSGTHAPATSAESQAAKILAAAGATVKRMKFNGLQHNKVFIAKRDSAAFKVLCGSCNHSFRGLYIQANNVLVFSQPDIAGLFAQYFQSALDNPTTFSSSDLASKWHLFQPAGLPAVHVCLAPHKDSDLSLNPLRGAIDQANSSVFYNIAFLNQIQSGPTRDAIDRLMQRPVFSYGVSDKKGNLEVRKPDGSIGLVDFAYLAAKSPEPFKSEWSGQQGINIHHKFVVTDFSLPTAKVFTGSSNLAPSGEKGNGDHLLMIEDQKVAAGYAIEAIRVFDHLQFRSAMKSAKTKPTLITLWKPKAISKKTAAWFDEYYVPNSQKLRDRTLFSH